MLLHFKILKIGNNNLIQNDLPKDKKTPNKPCLLNLHKLLRVLN